MWSRTVSLWVSHLPWAVFLSRFSHSPSHFFPPCLRQIYTDWANHYLAKSGHKRLIKDLQQDIADGVLLAEIIQIIGETCPLTTRRGSARCSFATRSLGLMHTESWHVPEMSVPISYLIKCVYMRLEKAFWPRFEIAQTVFACIASSEMKAWLSHMPPMCAFR